MLGAQLSSGCNLDMATVYLTALKATLDDSLDIFADVILNPDFPEADFERQRQLQLAAISNEKVTPIQMALRALPPILYGKGHAYGSPLTGSGTEETVQQMKREDMQRYHDTWFKPNNATLIVVGDTTVAEIKPKLEALFAGWKPGDVPVKHMADGGATGKASDLFGGQAGCGAFGGAFGNDCACAEDGRRSGAGDDEQCVWWYVQRAFEYEFARREALVIRRGFACCMGGGAAAVFGVRFGAGRQDGRFDCGNAQGIEGHDGCRG